MKKKGNYGYIHFQKQFTAARTLLLFAMALGIYFIAYRILQTNRSLWTILAILGLLPASKSAVNMIMFFRFRSLREAQFATFQTAAGVLPLLYENILTTSEKTYYLPVIAYCNHTLISYCTGEKVDFKKIEAHLKDSLKIGKLDVTVKVFPEESQFMERLHSMQSMTPEEKNEEIRTLVYDTVKVISL